MWQLLCEVPEVRACEGATDLICMAYVLGHISRNEER